MKINKEQIKDIARQLENGYNVYLNKDTGEYRALPDVDEFSEANEFRTDELRKITNHWENYTIITRMESWEIFEMMEEFMADVDDELHEKLLNALYRPQPLANFQNTVEKSEFRDQWYAFKDEKYISYVEDQLEAEGFFGEEPG
jgi:hypothetical protein